MAKVLLIDDEPTVRAGVRRVLAGMGHDVLEAEDGRAAMKLSAREEVDLVITDINMPEADGIEVILDLVQRRPQVPVIAISGGGLMDKSLLLQNAATLGARYTLAKPFDLEVLRNTVSDALGEERS